MLWDKSTGHVILDKVTDTTYDLYMSQETSTIPAISEFIIANYLSDNFYKLEYTLDHIKWYIQDSDDFYIIYIISSGLIIGCIICKIVDIVKNYYSLSIMEVNFLCVHKKYRGSCLTKLLLNKINELCESRNIENCMYTSSYKHSVPSFTLDRYYFPLNHLKLHRANILNIKDITMKRLTASTIKKPSGIKIHKNPHITREILETFDNFNKNFDIYKKMSDTDVKRINDNKIMTNFIVTLKSKIIGFISYYHLNMFNGDLTINQVFLYDYYFDDKNIQNLKKLICWTFKYLSGIDRVIVEESKYIKKDNHDDLFIVRSKNINYHLYNKESLEQINKDNVKLFIP